MGLGAYLDETIAEDSHTLGQVAINRPGRASHRKSRRQPLYLGLPGLQNHGKEMPMV